MSPETNANMPDNLESSVDIAEETNSALSDLAADVLQPLTDVPAKIEAIKQETGQDLEKLQQEILDTAIADTKKNIEEYSQKMEGLTEAEKITEAELYELLQKAMETAIGSTEELAKYSTLLGLKQISGIAELAGKDDDIYLDEEEMLQSTYDENVDPHTQLDSHVLSVFSEYSSEMEAVTSPEELKTFLLEKWDEVRTLLVQKYAPKTEKTAHETSMKMGDEGMMAGLQGLISQVPGNHTELDKFYNAIAFVGGFVDDGEYVDRDGRLNEAKADQAIRTQIDLICEKATPETFNEYKEATKELTKTQQNEKKETLLKSIPENFQGSEFERKYTVYIEQSFINKNWIPKGFDEWLVERPKPGGIGGMLDSLKVLIAQSGLGKFFKDIFGKGSWIGSLLGYGEKKEDKKEVAEGEEKPEEKKKRIEKEDKIIEELQEPSKWDDVNISGIKKKDFLGTGTELSEENRKHLEILQKALNATPGTILAVARTKGLTIESIKTLDEMGEKVIFSAENESFTIKGDLDKTPYELNDTDITKAKEVVPKDDIEAILGKDFAKRFDVEKLPDGLFKSGEKTSDNLHKSVQYLLKLPNTVWGKYKFTEKDCELLAEKIKSGAIHEDLFILDRDNDFDVLQADGTTKEVDRKTKRDVIQIDGTTNKWAFWDPWDVRVENIETLMAWLKHNI